MRPNLDAQTAKVGKMFLARPRKQIHRTSLELGVSQTSIQRNLKKHQFHTYKLQLLHDMTDNDLNSQLECVIGFWKSWKGTQSFLFTGKFTNEANFYINGQVNLKKSALLV